jgi:hypothetical protein
MALKSGDRGGHETGLFRTMLWRGRASEETSLCITGYSEPIVWEKVLQRVKEKRNNLQRMNAKKEN